MRLFSTVLLCFILISVSACSGVSYVSQAVTGMVSPPPPKGKGTFKVGSPYKIAGKWYRPQEDYNYTETGIASWYGEKFHGRLTANGEVYDMNELTAAHRTLQLPSLVRVTNLENGRSIVVRINDRGPFARGRIIDMSKRGAELLGFKRKGTARVKVQVLAQESKEVARAAKQGHDTSGTEIAMNDAKVQASERNYQQPTSLISQERAAPVNTVQNGSSLKPVETVSLDMPNVQGHASSGNFYPDQIVKQLPVTPTNIYVQAGSFSNKDNAVRLAQKLQSIGNAKVYPAQVNGQQFFRVRIPSSDVANADIILNRLVSSGSADAMILVE